MNGRFKINLYLFPKILKPFFPMGKLAEKEEIVNFTSFSPFHSPPFPSFCKNSPSPTPIDII
jgi:hypothetical protein